MVRAVAPPTTHRPLTDRLAAAVLLLALCLAGLALTPGAAGAAPGTYTNPVSRDFADTFADPAVIRAKDGYWYAYGTTDPLREGEGTRHIIPTARSADLVNWTYVGDAFTESTLPGWAAPDAALWAPDIRYLDGVYYLYYVVTQTTVTDGRDDNAVGVATAPTPTGPWTDSGGPVVGPRRGDSGNPGDFKWTFDPSQFTDADGTRYLYYGSYYGGIFVTELSDDGTEAVGEPTMVAIDNRYEGAYVVRHGALVLPVRLRGQLLRRPDHRLHGVRRPLDQPTGAVLRPRRHLAGDLAGRRHDRGHPQRQQLGRHRPQRRRHRPGRPGLARLPRHRPPRPVPGRAVRHQPAADAARPPRLGRRLADGQGRPLGLGGAAAGPGHRLGGQRQLRAGRAGQLRA